MKRSLLIYSVMGVFLLGCVSAPDIHKAAREGDAQKVGKIMDEGVFPDLPDQWGQRPLHHASNGGHLEVVRALLDRGADPDGLDNRDYRPVHHACDPAVLALLLERGADPDPKNEDKITPLHEVMRCPEKEHILVRLLVEAGADVDGKDSLGLTPLHLAAGYADRAAAELLLKSSAEVNAENAQGLTARDMAVVTGKTGIVDVLDKYGGRSNRYFAQDGTPAQFERGQLIGTGTAVPMEKSFEMDSGFADFRLDIDRDGADTVTTKILPLNFYSHSSYSYSSYTYKGFDTVLGRFFAEPGHTYIIDAQYQTGSQSAYAIARDKETGRVVGYFR